MVKVKFNDGRVFLTEMGKPKKITGTRFGAVLNVNPWLTPFQAWCEITKAWVKPFEGSIYTEAGKVIEDKQLTWFSRYVSVVRPAEIYGEDFFNKTYGDFFKENPVFGGMWDALVGEKNNVEGVIECKTTKRSEDWEYDVPEYYALQAALYATLLNVDDVYMIVTFLDDGDYEHPENFICNADNTTYFSFKVSERYPDFKKYMDYCIQFWDDNIIQGISPMYDEKKDKEYLDALRTGIIDSDEDIEKLIREAEELYELVDAVKASIKTQEKRLKEIEGMLKEYAIEHQEAGQTKSVFKGSSYTWTVSKTEKKELDVNRLKEQGIYNDYLTSTTSYTIRKSENKGE